MSVPDVMLSADRLVDLLGHKELQLKNLGQVNQANGLRYAIMIVLQEAREALAGGADAAGAPPVSPEP